MCGFVSGPCMLLHQLSKCQNSADVTETSVGHAHHARVYPTVASSMFRNESSIRLRCVITAPHGRSTCAAQMRLPDVSHASFLTIAVTSGLGLPDLPLPKPWRAPPPPLRAPAAPPPFLAPSACAPPGRTSSPSLPASIAHAIDQDSAVHHANQGTMRMQGGCRRAAGTDSLASARPQPLSCSQHKGTACGSG